MPNTLVTATAIEVAPHNANYADLGAEISGSLATDGQSQMIGQLKIASGTVGAPGLAPASDLDTGIYRIGGDNLGVACAGAKVLDIATTGLGVTGTLTASGALTAASASITTPLPVASGGTSGATATAAFNALSPVTTRGDIITRDATNNVRLAVGAADTVLKSDGTDPSWAKIVNANITDATIAHGKLASAVTADQTAMEAASATDSFASPGNLKYHPGVAKFWAYITVSGGTPTLVASHNVSGITDHAAGDITITFSTPFSSANYAVIGTGGLNGDYGVVTVAPTGRAAGSIRLHYGLSGFGTIEPSQWNVMGFGDQ